MRHYYNCDVCHWPTDIRDAHHMVLTNPDGRPDYKYLCQRCCYRIKSFIGTDPTKTAVETDCAEINPDINQLRFDGFYDDD